MTLKPKLLLITVVSFVTLALELHLTRVLAFVFWNHLVYLIVSLALLGYGIASTLVSLLEKKLEGEHGIRFVYGNAILAPLAVVALILFLGQTQMAFRLSDVLSSLPQLIVAYVLTTLIFVFCGNIVVYLFFATPTHASRLYSWDLFGAALACAIFPFSLVWLGGVKASLVACAALVGTAGISLFVGHGTQKHPRLLIACALATAAVSVLAASTDSISTFTPDRTKSLGRALDPSINPGVRHEHTQWDPVTRLDIVSSDKPIDIGWTKFEPPAKLITFDGDAISGIAPHAASFPSAAEKANYLAHDKTVPFMRREAGGEHLIIGLGGGPDIADSLLLGASKITAVDINGAILKAMTGPFAHYSGDLFNRPEVELHYSEGRAFLKRTNKTFDLIRMTGVDTFTALSTGAYVMAENHLYTIEAIQDYFARLRPDGVLRIHRWFYDARPRETLRLFAIMLEALRREGIEHPEQHVAVMRNPDWAVTMLRRSPFSKAEAEQLARESTARGSIAIFVPGVPISSHPASRIFHEYADSFVAGTEAKYAADYPYDITPVDDDRPFFFNYYKVDRIFSGDATGPIQGYWAYFVFLIILLLAVLAVVLAIWLPLLVRKREGLSVPFAKAGIGYFAALGCGFIMLEIALMQRLALYLGHPSYSIAVVMGTMLLATGIGSTLGNRISDPSTRVTYAAIAVVVLSVFLSTRGLPAILNATIGLHIVMKILITCALIGPLAIGLGIFFPTGLATVAGSRPEFVPWAWGINSGFTVIGSVLAVILAMWLGFSTVIQLASAVYLATPLLFSRLAAKCEAPSAKAIGPAEVVAGA